MMAGPYNTFPLPKLLAEPPRATYAKNWGYLKRERNLYLRTWEDMADYILPFIGMKYEYDVNNTDRGRPNRSRRAPIIINNKGTMAARTLINGLASGLTSPSRPWIKFGVPQDTEQPDYDGKRWLFGASKSVLWLCQKSNYYTATKMQYRDITVFGIGTKILDEHSEHDLNCINAPIGSYCVFLGEDGRPQGIHRETIWTVSQLVERFSYSRCSKEVQRNYDQGDYYLLHKVCHVIEPNRLYQRQGYGAAGMRWASVYYEMNCAENEEQLLSMKGYNTKPFSCARWDYLPGDTYGSSAGMETIGDIKALQVLEHRKAQAVDKQVTPPTQSPPSLINQRINHMPGANTAVPEIAGKITSLYDVRPDMISLSNEIQRHENRIDEAFYVDVLRSVTDLTRQNVKAEEIFERREEKMLMLSPMLENMYTELLDVDVMRMLQIGMQIGLIPPPPKSLGERALSITYTSTLAQAQRAIGVAPIERLFTFAGSVAGVYPEVKDGLDADAAVREYADAIGAPPSLMVPENVVAQLRQQRQQAAEQQQAAQQTAVGVDAAKNLSEAKLTDPSMLSFLIGNGQ